MITTWTVLRVRPASVTAPWTPEGATWWQAGHSSAGTAQAPAADGQWWSVLATWEDVHAAAGPPPTEDLDVWHLLLEPVSMHGEVVLQDGAPPFDGLPDAAELAGPTAVITVAGPSPDVAREREFFRRFGHVSRDIARAQGHLLSLISAPVAPGPVLTLSVWTDLGSAVDWAYTTSLPHARAVPRQRAHGLVSTSGSVRCAVLSSGGALGELGNPLAGVQLTSGVGSRAAGSCR
jgi:hypothetical protein